MKFKVIVTLVTILILGGLFSVGYLVFFNQKPDHTFALKQWEQTLVNPVSSAVLKGKQYLEETRDPYPANTNTYDVSALPDATVLEVIPGLPVDDNPQGETTNLVISAKESPAPIFASPLDNQPLARLPLEHVHGGVSVPVIEQYQNWVRVLLAGRAGLPSQGISGQLTGWVRVSDINFTQNDTRVELSISARTITVVSPNGSEVIATDFGWGKEATPTPMGRTFIMLTEVVPQFTYTQGHPIVYLGIQSTTLDEFSGTPAAITAFHYYGIRSGAISNGCVRVDAQGITKLSALPAGTAVILAP